MKRVEFLTCRGVRSLVLMFVLCVLWEASFAITEVLAQEEWEYDPALCPTEANGKIYHSFGNAVLGFVPPKVVKVPRIGKKQRALPPNPEAPLGCPGNPVLQQAVHFGVSLSEIEDTLPPNPRNRARIDNLVLSAKDPEAFLRNPVQGGAARGFRNCHRRPVHVVDKLPSGLVICRASPGDESESLEKWSYSAQAERNVYRTPLGRPFSISCWSGGNPCDVSYILTPDMSVSYRFHRHLLPFDRLIEADKILRRKILEMIVPNYVWARTTLTSELVEKFKEQNNE